MIEQAVIDNFKYSLRQHIAYVYQAGEKLGIPQDVLLHHDDSKWTKAELKHYARNFFGDKGDPDGFALAWLHLSDGGSNGLAMLFILIGLRKA